MIWTEQKEAAGKRIINAAYKNGMIMTWYRDRPEGWTLMNLSKSPLYINLRPMPSFPDSQAILKDVGSTVGNMVKNECPYVNKLLGVASTGIPITTAVTMESGIPSCYTRKLASNIKTVEQLDNDVKQYGQHEQVEGKINEGDIFGIVDDLVTGFDSKLLAYQQLKHQAESLKVNVSCKDVLVVFDREQGAEATAKENGMNLHSIIPFRTKGLEWLRDSMSKVEYEVITDYLNNSKLYQTKEKWDELKRLALKA
jgi:orotate phosphoribosyltransferase